MKNRITTQRRPATISALLSIAILSASCGASDTSDASDAAEVLADGPGETMSTQATGSPAQGSETPVVTARPDAAQDEASTSAAPAQSTSAPTSTAEADQTTTSSTMPADEQPGEPFDFGMAAGSDLTVIGVVWNDDLNFRTGPGTNNPVLTAIESIDTDRNLVAAGEAWNIDGSIWWKVTVDGTEAWASQRYLAAPGQSDNVFDEVAEGLGVLKAETLASLAEDVAGTRPAGGPTPRVVLVAEPLVFEGSGATVTVDILDLGDDALVGERLRITAALIMSDGDEPTVEAFVLTDVTRTILCGRGVQEGLCV